MEIFPQVNEQSLNPTCFDAAWVGRTIGVDQWHRSTTQYSPKKRKHFSRIYVSPAYTRFIEELAMSFMRGAREAQWPMGYEGYVDLEITAWLWRMKDSDGIEKPLCDSLERSGIIANDRQIRHKWLWRHYHRKNELDMIKIYLVAVGDDELLGIEKEQKEGYASEA